MADIVIKELGPLWTLDEVKLHLRVDDDEQDSLIEGLMEGAEQAMLAMCNITLVPHHKEATFKVAGLMIVGHWFANREAVNVGNITSELPFGARSILWPHRWLPI